MEEIFTIEMQQVMKRNEQRLFNTRLIDNSFSKLFVECFLNFFTL